MKADKLYLGNVITMDDYKQRAEAVAVKDGLILYVGDAAIARSLCDENTEVIDLGKNTIYPGFMEAHCHPLGAGALLDRDAVADLSSAENLEEYVALMDAFIKAHPGKSAYKGQGFVEREVQPYAALLDAICPDAPIIINTVDGHSMWLNSKAMEQFHIDKAAVEEFGVDLVRVNADGNPTGYVSETPAFIIRKQMLADPEDEKKFLMNAQNFFFGHGYTAVYDAGLELIEKQCADRYMDVINSGKFKLRIFTGSLVDEFCEDIPAAVANIVELQKKYNNDYFKIIGVKTFSDGVIEAHTAYLLEDYVDAPGSKGTARLVDHAMLTQLYAEAARHNMNVHVHTVGDGAIRVNLDAMEEAAKITGNMDQRNALAHLQQVDPADFKRFADLNVVAAVASLWTPKHPDYFPQEVAYVGEERAERAYPIKSFIDAGAPIVFHTDFPVSQNVSIPNAVFTAVKRRNSDGAEDTVRKADEFITRYQALAAMTKNVAYMWHEEARMGTLEVGKLANMTVFDKDFLADELDDLAQAKVVCTIVDGDIVYQA